MKRFFALMLLAIMLLASCATDLETESSEPEESVVESALALVEEGKFEQAYALLYKNRDNEEARKMLDDFKVLCTKETLTTYEAYNHVAERDYNEHGDEIRHVEEHFADGFCYKYKFDYKYIYDENGNVLCKDRYIMDTDELEERYEYTYDENGNLVNLTERSYSLNTDGVNENVYTRYYEYEYDADGNVTYIKDYGMDGEVEVDVTFTQNVYDERGLLIKKQYSNENYTNTIEYTVNEHGDAISVKTTTCYVDEDPFVRSDKTIEYEYDEEGRHTKVTTFSAGELYETVEYTYNENGDVIREFKIDQQGKRDELKTEIEYYADGKKRKEICVHNRYSANSATYQYDEYGNEISAKSEKSERISEYTYNDEGLVVKLVQNTGRDGGKQVTEYIYDESGKVIEKASYPIDRPDDKVIYTYTYDGEDCIKEEETYRSRTETTEYRYVYDENGRLVEKTTIERNNETKIACEYDEKGNEIKIIAVDEDGNAKGWLEKSYDEEGNLVKIVRVNPDERKNQFQYTQNFTYNENGIKTSEFSQYLDYATASENEYLEFIYLYLPQK